MKRILPATLLLMICLSSYAQRTAITYYDSAWQLTIKPFGKYYRIGIIDLEGYQYHGEVKDYYINGKLQMKGKFQSNIKVDTFYYYYPSGALMTKGPYQNNMRSGIWTYYYENGRIKDKVFFNGDFVYTLENFDETGNPKVVNGTGEWKVEYYRDYIEDIVSVVAQFKNTLRHGKWVYHRRSATPGSDHVQMLESVEEYDNGRFLRGKYYWGGDSTQHIDHPVVNILPEPQKFKNLEKWTASKYASIEAYPYLKFLPKVDSSVFPVDKKAEFPGGVDSLTTFFTKNMKLSKSYVFSQKIRLLMFDILIDENGSLTITNDPNAITLRAYPGNQVFYTQALKAIKTLPAWEPAKRNQRNVKNHFFLTIHLDSGKITVRLNSLN